MKLSDLIIEHGPYTWDEAQQEPRPDISGQLCDAAALNELREELMAAREAGERLPAILNWAADEIDAQAAAHHVDEPQIIDLTDHIRCFADQPKRRSLIPWPDGVPRPELRQFTIEADVDCNDAPLLRTVCDRCGIETEQRDGQLGLAELNRRAGEHAEVCR